MSVVVFDPTAFKAGYPEFSAVADGVLTTCFNEATLYLSNADNSPVFNVVRRSILLNMLVAHIAYLKGYSSATGSGVGAIPVGRTSAASEGSVSASLEYNAPGSAAWFVQTQYGAAFWQATLSLRSFIYIPNPTRY